MTNNQLTTELVSDGYLNQMIKYSSTAATVSISEVRAMAREIQERRKAVAESVVPDEMNPTTIRTIAVEWSYELDDDEANVAADGWNACRTAVLQSLGNSEQLNHSERLLDMVEPVSRTYRLPAE